MDPIHIREAVNVSNGVRRQLFLAAQAYRGEFVPLKPLTPFKSRLTHYPRGGSVCATADGISIKVQQTIGAVYNVNCL